MELGRARRFIGQIALAGLLLPGVQSVYAADPVADALNGAWLVSVGNQTRERFMILSGAKAQRGEVTVESATYGYIDTRGAPIKSWKGQVSGDALSLSFVTPGDAQVDVRMAVDETTSLGSFVFKNGTRAEVRLTRLPQEELAELRAAARQAKSAAGAKFASQKPRANANSKIYLVYVGSPDCPSCRGYEAEYFGRKDLMAKQVPDFPKITYVDAGIVSYRSRVPLGNVPPELAWLGEADASGKTPIRRRGVPFFALVVDDKIWAQGHGTVALENLIAPEIKRAVAERSGS